MAKVDSVLRFSAIFLKKASSNLLPLGGSTVTVQMATDIAKKALQALSEIDDGAKASFAHKIFESVMKKIADGQIPDSSEIEGAINEFNTGLKFFANMQGINVPSLMNIL